MPTNPTPATLPAAFPILWGIALATVFVCLVIGGVGAYHFSADELMHIDIARGTSLREVLRFSTFEPHPPLGHILRHYWIAISEDPAFVRSQSLLFGLAAIALYYRIGALTGGRLVGLCMTVFAAFCPSVILQSYIVRNYAFFIFFLSLCVYCYFRWQHTRERRHLVYYGIAGALTAMTHLSSMFALACIGAFEVIDWWQRKEPWRNLVPWIGVHIAIGTLAIAVWWMLLPMGIAPFQHYARDLTEFHWQLGRIYPQRTLGFLLPYPGSPLYEPWLLLGVAALLAVAGWFDARLRPYLGLLAGALLLGAVLRGGDFYPFMDPRHVLWLLPFLALCCGWALALGIEMLQRYARIPASMCLLLVLASGWALYSPEKRFRQIFEYQITEAAWQQFSGYLSGLDSRHLIVARRADALLIDPEGHNPYRYMGKDAALIATVPYHATRILFDPTRANSFHYLDDLPLRMIREADTKGLLDGVDTLVFVNTSWTSRISRHMVQLAMCQTLPKTIIRIPETGTPTRNPSDLYRSPATLMLVPKHVFLEQVLSENGSAKVCLE